MAIPYYRAQDIGWTGPAFPFLVNDRGSIHTATADIDAEDFRIVKMAVEQLLRTPVGSRFFNRKFGAAPVGIVFRLNTPEHIMLALSEIHDIMRKWEPRVIIRGYDIVDSNPDQGYVRVRIDFDYLKGQTPDSIEVSYS